MAASFPVDLITCSVCFNIYTEPQILKCLNTFCRQCMQKLKQDSSIQCPECRVSTLYVDIKNDFNKQSLIDRYEGEPDFKKQKRIQVGVRLPHQCEFCSDPSKAIHAQCIDCEQFMCSDCTVIHKATKPCKNHELRNISEIVTSIQDNVKDHLQVFENGKVEILKDSTILSKAVKKIEESKAKQLSDVAKYKQDILIEIEKYCDDLNKTILEVNNNIINKLKQSKRQSDQILQQNNDTLTEILLIENLSLLSEKASKVDFGDSKKMEKLKEQIPISKGVQKSPLEVGYYFNLTDIMNILHLELNGKKYTREIIPSPITDILNYQYEKQVQAVLPFYAQRMHMANKEMYIALHDGLHIYNLDCELLRKIQDARINTCTGIAITHTGDIIVSCSEVFGHSGQGLNHLKANGLYNQEIMKGQFSDVVFFDNRLYALNNDLCKILVFEESNNHWLQVKDIPLSFSNNDLWDKMCVTPTGICVSSYNNNSLYLYSFQGCHIKKVGKGGDKAPGNLNRPFICNSDPFDNWLVADYYHRCLQIYTPEDDKWSIVPIDVKYMQNAVVEHSVNNIWITNDEKHLMKFTKV